MYLSHGKRREKEREREREKEREKMEKEMGKEKEKEKEKGWAREMRKSCEMSAPNIFSVESDARQPWHLEQEQK